MAVRRQSSYARVYSYGAVGATALSGRPVIRSRPLERQPIRTSSQHGLRAPLWAVIIALAGVIFMLSFAVLGVRSQATSAAKAVSELSEELSRVGERIAALEIKIEEANDPVRLHSIAVNRLGMHQPTQDQVIKLARPPETPVKLVMQQTEHQEGGILRLLLSIVGI